MILKNQPAKGEEPEALSVLQGYWNMKSIRVSKGFASVKLMSVSFWGNTVHRARGCAHSLTHHTLVCAHCNTLTQHVGVRTHSTAHGCAQSLVQIARGCAHTQHGGARRHFHTQHTDVRTHSRMLTHGLHCRVLHVSPSRPRDPRRRGRPSSLW